MRAIAVTPSSKLDPARAVNASGRARASMDIDGFVKILAHKDTDEMLGMLVLFLVVMGGLFMGVFTATESAAVGAVGAFVVAWVRGKLKRDAFWGVSL